MTSAEMDGLKYAADHDYLIEIDFADRVRPRFLYLVTGTEDVVNNGFHYVASDMLKQVETTWPMGTVELYFDNTAGDWGRRLKMPSSDIKLSMHSYLRKSGARVLVFAGSCAAVLYVGNVTRVTFAPKQFPKVRAS